MSIPEISNLTFPIFPVRVTPDPERPGHFLKKPLRKWRDPINRQCGAWWAEHGWPAEANAVGCVPADRGLICIDLDRGHDQRWAVDNLPQTRRHLTPSGGLHAYYLCDELLTNSSGTLPPCIDVRSANGYVVWAGPGYVVAAARDPVPLPPAIRAMLRSVEEEGPRSNDYADDDDPLWAGKAAAWLAAQPETAEGWQIAAALVRNFGLTDRMAVLLWDEWQAGFSDQWDAHEQEVRLASARAPSETRRGDGVAFDIPEPEGSPAEKFGRYVEPKVSRAGRYPHHDPIEDFRLPELTYLDAEKTLPRVPGGCVVLVIGAKSAHKTGTVMKKAIEAIKAGLKVLFIATEGSHGVRTTRLKAYMEHYNVSPADLRERWRTVPENFNLLLDCDKDALADSYGEWNPDLIVIDVLAKSVPGEDLAAIAAGTKIMARADELARAFDATLIITTHPPKASASGEAAGSVFFGALTFAEWHISKHGGMVRCWIDKMRDGEAERLVCYEIKAGSPPIVGSTVAGEELKRRAVESSEPPPEVATILAILANDPKNEFDTAKLADTMVSAHLHDGIKDRQRRIRIIVKAGCLDGLCHIRVEGKGANIRYFLKHR